MSSPSSPNNNGNNNNTGSPSKRSSGLANGASWNEDDDDDYTPSKQDFDRNFDTPHSPSPPNEESFSDEPLMPGLYKALYAFVPEGTAEMALEEDQVVKIVGRGGGVGWAIALNEGAGASGENAHALVPESYLEFISPLEAQEDEDGEDMEPEPTPRGDVDIPPVE